ncbi:hypothetical protein J6590_035296 [Homalodisca vitripennis]|nr:hypothetical protein J6590_035296 [Homalodisca vitripennis]
MVHTVILTELTISFAFVNIRQSRPILNLNHFQYRYVKSHQTSPASAPGSFCWNAYNADRESWILPHTDAFAYSSCVQLSPSDPPLSNLTTPLHHRPKMIRRGHLPPTRPPTGQTRQ